jgi:hypothetical protein
MLSAPTIFRRAATALIATNLLGAVAASYCLVAARRAAHRGDDTFFALSDDVTRASQAQVAAERMVAVGRAYLLSTEPELLLRAQAADAKLTRTLTLLEQGAFDEDERRRLDDVNAAARGYRAVFATLLSDASMHGDPHLAATALRTRLIPARELLTSELDQLVGRRQASLNGQRVLARESSRRWMIAFVVLGIGALALSLSLVWYLWSALRIYRARLEEARSRPQSDLDRRRSGAPSRPRVRPMTRPVA